MSRRKLTGIKGLQATLRRKKSGFNANLIGSYAFLPKNPSRISIPKMGRIPAKQT